MTISLSDVLNARKSDDVFAKRDTPWSIGGSQSAQARQTPIKLPEGSMLPPDPEIRQGLIDIARQAKINPALLLAMAHQESTYNPNADGPTTKWGKAKGMFQFLDATAAGHGIDPYDWRQAGTAAAKDLADQIAREGIDWAVAHHHAGPNKKQHGPKTAQYTREVLAKAQAIAKELGEDLLIPEDQIPDFGAADLDETGGISLDEVLAAQQQPQDFSNVSSDVRSTEDSVGEPFMDTLRRAAGSPAIPGTGPAEMLVRGVTNTVERGWEGIQNFINRETQVVERSDDELRRLWQEEFRGSGLRPEGPMYERWAEHNRTVRVSTKPFEQEEAEWAQRLQENPEDAHMLPRRLAHLRPKADDSNFAPANTFKGVMQRFVANHRNPIELMLQESIPADLVTGLFTLPELERKKFDQARSISKAFDITSSPEQYSEEDLEEATAHINEWKRSVDPSVAAAWDQLWQAAKEDPAAVLTGFSEALWADPYMAAAPAGSGLIKPIRAAQAARKIGAPTIAGRAGKIADRILDGSITTAGINVAAGMADNFSEFGKVNDEEVKLNAAIGAVTGGLLGPLFMRSARAKTKSIDAHKAQGTLDEALRDMAKAEVELEDLAKQAGQTDEEFRLIESALNKEESRKRAAANRRISELLGIRSEKDTAAWLKQRRKEVKDWFGENAEYADYQRMMAEARLEKVEALRAEAEARLRGRAEAAYGTTPETPEARSLRLAEEFEAAVAARNAAEEAGELDAAVKADEAWEAARRLNAEEMYYAQLSQDAPTIRQTEAKIARRNDALGRHRRKRGELGAADPKVLAAMGITAAGATAGAAMFPKEPEKGMLAGAIISGLSAVGLGKARGGRSPGSLRRISQEGAIKPKGGNWADRSADRLAFALGPGEHIYKVVQRYLQRYAGTTDDPLKDLALPDGTRWEDAVDAALHSSTKLGKTSNKFNENLYSLHLADTPPGHSRPMAAGDRARTQQAAGNAFAKISSYLNHVGDYLRTLPESEVAKMDFVRMVKETKRWDEANARKMEKAQVRLFKDAEVLREYDDGFKWIRLNKPGQFANESDLMGHSVRGYEPEGSVPRRTPSGAIDGYQTNPEWIPEAVGGHADYGYGGWDAIKSDRVRVYSLRDSNGKPVATIEVGAWWEGTKKGWEIAQVKGPRNEPVKAKYADKVNNFIDVLRKTTNTHVVNHAMDDMDGLNMRNQEGRASPETLARLGVVGAGAAAGLALFPEDEKLAGGLLGGLAGLLAPAGGSVLSRMRQAGAIDPNGNIIAGLVKAGKMANKLDEAEIKARDAAWIDATRAGDQQAFKALYDAYKPSIERYSKRFTQNLESRTAIDAEDIAQRAMLDLYQAALAPDFTPEKGVGAWLRDVAYKRATDELRKSSATKRDANVVNESQHYKEDLYEGDMGSSRSVLDETTGIDDFSQETINQLPETPENARYREELLDIIRQELDKLPSKHQQLFAMTQLDHFDLREAAEQLGISYDNARQISSRVERSVRNAISEGRRKFGEEPDLSAMGMARGQRGSADPSLVKAAAVISVATAAGTAGYFMYDGDPWRTGLLTAGVAGGGALVAKGGLGKVLRGIDYRMREYGESFYGLTKKHGFSELKRIREFNNDTADFVEIMRHVPNDIKPIVVRALSTRNNKVIDKVLEQVGGKEFVEAFAKVRKRLDLVEDELVKLGLISKSELDYYPFRVKDLEGLKSAISEKYDKVYRTEIEEALQKAAKKKGEPLTAIEQDIVLNKVLAPLLGKSTAGHMPGFAKARTILEIPEDLQPFYHDSIEALNSYGVQSSKYIEKAKFFGQHLRKKKDGKHEFVDNEESIGSMLRAYREAGEITDQQAYELGQILRDRFGGGEQVPHRYIQRMKNIVNGTLLGNIYSAATQLGDLALQMAVQGPRASIKALWRQLTRDKFLDLSDLGLNEHVAHEFLSDDATRKFADWSFKWGGFRAVDATGKNFGLNASISRMMRQAQTQKGLLELADQYQRAFPEDFPKAVNALKKGEVNEAVELLAFTELTRTQPLTGWELPQWYHSNPNGRVLYHLQTFSLRVVNLVYEDAFKKITSGNAKQFRQGVGNLVKIGAALGIGGVTTDKIKDLMSGRPIELDPMEIPVNALEALGISMYDYRQMADKSPITSVVDSKLPPIVSMSEDVWKEPGKTVSYLPVGGRVVYNHMRQQEWYQERVRKRRKKYGYKLEIKVPPKESGSGGSSRGGRGSRGSRDRGGR